MDKLEDFMFPKTSYPIWDVVIEGKTKTAVQYEGQWYLFPVNFKFGHEDHPGHPFLSFNRELIEMVSEDYLKTLPKWTYNHKTGKLNIENK